MAARVYVSAILLHTGYLIRPFSPEFTRTAEKAHSLFFNYSNGILASKNYVGSQMSVQRHENLIDSVVPAEKLKICILEMLQYTRKREKTLWII